MKCPSDRGAGQTVFRRKPLALRLPKTADFSFRKRAPTSGGEVADRDRSDPAADEALHFVSEVVEHEADLAFEPLFEDHREAPVGNDGGIRCAGKTLGRFEPADEQGEVLFLERSVQGDEVFLFDLVTRMGEGEGEVAVVGEDEETLAFAVESADVVERFEMAWEEVDHGFPAFFVRARGDDAPRLVEDDRHGCLGLDPFSVEFDPVTF